MRCCRSSSGSTPFRVAGITATRKMFVHVARLGPRRFPNLHHNHQGQHRAADPSRLSRRHCSRRLAGGAPKRSPSRPNYAPSPPEEDGAKRCRFLSRRRLSRREVPSSHRAVSRTAGRRCSPSRRVSSVRCGPASELHRAERADKCPPRCRSIRSVRSSRPHAKSALWLCASCTTTRKAATKWLRSLCWIAVRADDA